MPFPYPTPWPWPLCVLSHPPQRARSCPQRRPLKTGAPTRTRLRSKCKCAEGCALARRKGFPHNFCFAKITRYNRALR